ncbi:MAG TPA: polyprenyl diphosphate synthase [Longimicrobiales bacterium]|nr:polyprenyl diphosphate synthase [Longimicrobiales bacterium]
MTQRARQENGGAGLHVAMIMDGNGRWARRRGMPRGFGHGEGAKAVRRVVEAAADPASGIDLLTLYAFSSDNWQRPRDEVRGVMALFLEYLRRETARCVENDVRLVVVGRRDRLTPRLVREIQIAESATAGRTGLLLRLAVDYSARDVILRAAAMAAEQATECVEAGGDAGPFCREAFRACMGAAEGGGGPVRDVDLLIRTGGEQRLSDFLLWECAYAELYFTPTLWPDFEEAELRRAVADFHRRERRFGGVLEEAV